MCMYSHYPFTGYALGVFIYIKAHFIYITACTVGKQLLFITSPFLNLEYTLLPWIRGSNLSFIISSLAFILFFKHNNYPYHQIGSYHRDERLTLWLCGSFLERSNEAQYLTTHSRTFRFVVVRNSNTLPLKLTCSCSLILCWFRDVFCPHKHLY